MSEDQENKQREEYKKILKHEKTIYYFTYLVLPVAILIGVFFIFLLTYYDEVNEPLFLLPFAYPLIFLTIHANKFPRFRKPPKSSEFYFKNLGYEKAVIRFGFLDKLHLYSIVVLIIAGLFVGFGLQSTLQTIEENRKYYIEKYAEYREEVTHVDKMTDGELKSFLKEKINSMYDYELFGFVREIIKDELEKKAMTTNDDNLRENVWPLSYNMTEEMTVDQRRDKAFQTIDTMSTEQLKTRSIGFVEKERPYESLYDNTAYVKQKDFLVALAMIPGIMVYTIFTFKLPMTRRDDFNFYFAVGCFKIVNNFVFLDEMEKRKYVMVGIKSYNKYLKKNLGMGVNNLDMIHSAMLATSSQGLSDISGTIIEKMEKNHRLEFLGFLDSKIPHGEESRPTLITDSITDRLREGWLSFIIPTITTIIAILSLFRPAS